MKEKTAKIRFCHKNSLQQRTELHRTIWNIADELRGAVGGWEFKAYVLGTLFYRFISENLTDYINRLQQEAGVEGFDYADMDDDEAAPAKAQNHQHGIRQGCRGWCSSHSR